jgi:NADH-quinone oxidoreductase subunit D
MSFTLYVGPQHPSLKEPEHFKFEVEGEEVVKADIRLGYVHRGIERAMQDRSYPQNVYLAEHICGICNIVHSATYCQTIERLAGIDPPDRARYIRTIILELERIHSHLLWLGVAAHEMGFDTLFMLSWRDREKIMDIREMISGSRIHSAMNTIGGVRRDLRQAHSLKITEVLDEIEKAAERYLEIFASDRAIIARCEGVGILSKKSAVDLCAVGPTARASGVKVDIRKEDPYAAYEETPFEIVVENGGDVLARTLIRIREIFESIEIIRRALDMLPKGPIRERFVPQVAKAEAVCRSEAPRGELLYFAMSNGTERPERVRIRTPTYANVLSWQEMFKGCTIAEIPVVMWSIDPCFGCEDRVTIVDLDKGKTYSLSRQEMRKWSASTS